MNERIKELITQSGGYWNHGDFNMPSSVEFQEQDIEKFAELIIRECTEWVNDNVGLIDEEAKADLLKHFGVEE